MANPLNVTLDVRIDFKNPNPNTNVKQIQDTNFITGNNDNGAFTSFKLSSIIENHTAIKEIKKYSIVNDSDQDYQETGTKSNSIVNEKMVQNIIILVQPGKDHSIRAKLEFVGTDNNTYVEYSNNIKFTYLENIELVYLDKVQDFLNNSTEFGKKFKKINIPMIPVVFENDTKFAVRQEDLLRFITKKDCINPNAYYEKTYTTAVFGNITGKVEIKFDNKLFYLGSDLIDFLEA